MSRHSEKQAMLKDPVTLRVKWKSLSLAGNASHYLALDCCPFWAKMHTNTPQVILNYFKIMCLFFRPHVFSTWSFFSAQITILHLPAVLPSKLPFAFQLAQELLPLGGNCSAPRGMDYVPLFCALRASEKGSRSPHHSTLSFLFPKRANLLFSLPRPNSS